MVEAKGDSMENIISPRDWLIVEQDRCPHQRDIVVCVNQGEVMVKRFSQDGENIILESQNKKYSPIIADRDSFHIEGIVRSIIKRNF